LGGISDSEKISLGSRIFIIIYPALFGDIRGRDGMDGGKAYWMMFPFWEMPSKVMLGSGYAAGLNALGFS
jgi:hypothetical protein